MTEKSFGRITVTRESKQNLAILLLFLLSLLHVSLWVLFSILLFVPVLKKDTVGALKGLAIFVIRSTAMNPMIAATLGSLGVVRYFVILAFALGIISISENNREPRLRTLTLFLAVFFTYITLIAFTTSSYPVVSLTKGFLYIIVFYAVAKGVSSTIKDYDWCSFFEKTLSLLFFISLFTIPIMSLRVKNGRAFQGIFVHPNTFGIYGALLIAFLCMIKKEKKYLQLFLIVATLYMQYLSESRAGLIASLIIILIYFFTVYRNRIHKGLLAALCILIAVTVVLFMFPQAAGKFGSIVESFIYKGGEEYILYSRMGQIGRFQQKFEAHPYFGSGFMVPYQQGVVSYSMDFDLYVEQGNVFLAVLSELGIVGFVYWMLMNVWIFAKGNKKFVHLFAAPFIISSGEMVFFSTNSLGTILCFLFAIYLFCPKEYIDLQEDALREQYL